MGERSDRERGRIRRGEGGEVRGGIEMVGREGDSIEPTLKQQSMHSPVDH